MVTGYSPGTSKTATISMWGWTSGRKIFSLTNVSQEGRRMLYYEVIDPTNMESWLIYNREQNPFGGLNLNLDIQGDH